MIKHWKALLAGVTVCVLLLTFTPCGAFAAGGEFSVRVQPGKVNFLQDGAVVGSYATASTDLVIAYESRSGELLVQFPNNKGTFTNITLDRQRDLSVEGSMNSLTMRSSLPEDVTLSLEEGSKVSTLAVYSRSAVAISGKVTVADIYSAAMVEILDTGSASRVRLRSQGATLAAAGTVSALEKVSGALATGNGVGKITAVMGGSSSWARSSSGLLIDHSSTTSRNDDRYDRTGGQTTVQNGLTVKTYTIYAEYGDILDDLEGELGDAVRVYTSGGNRVYGDLSWLSDRYSEVTDTHYYRFSFWPDSNRYDEITGRVKVVADDYDRLSNRERSIYFEAEPIYTTSMTDLRLRDLEDDLNASVTAYSRSADEIINGEYRWSTPSTRVRNGGSYAFTFIPDSTRYRKTTGRVRVNVD